MASVTLKSTTLPAMVAEAARALYQAERALTVPLANISIQFGDVSLTINGTIPTAVTVDAATGNQISSLVDYTPDADPVLTGTVLSDVTATSLSKVLASAIVRQDQALQAKIDSLATVNPVASSSYSTGDAGFTFTVSLPIAYSIDAQGAQVISVPNYLA